MVHGINNGVERVAKHPPALLHGNSICLREFFTRFVASTLPIEWTRSPRVGTHQEGGARPDETRSGVEVSSLSQNVHFLVTNLQHLLLERRFPCVQLQNFDSVKHLVHELHALVFVLHLLDLQVLGFVGDDSVDGDQDDHDSETGKDARAENSPQEVDGKADLKRR